MNMKQLAVALAAIGTLPAATAVTFETESLKGSIDSTITTGFGRRMQAQSCALVGDVSGPCGSSADWGVWANADDGNLNYNKGDFFTTYLKGNHELLLSAPAGVKFMGRVNWLYDWSADRTRRTELRDDARDQMARDVNVMDLWVSKELELGDRQARFRIGNQVVSWGESLFALGGINATNAVDLVRLSNPGVQLKEVMIPAPIASFATGVADGVNFETYYQFRWNRYKFPASGSYWSQGDGFGKGRDKRTYFDAAQAPGAVGNFNLAGPDATTLDRLGMPVLAFANQDGDVTPKNGGQWGASLHWRPKGVDTDFGFYYLNYHDKTPNLTYWQGATTNNQWNFLSDRHLYGVSANTQIGNWAVGTELSYRPKDAVALTPCADAGANADGSNFTINTSGASFGSKCEGWVDQKRYQLHLTGILSLTPGDHGGFLDLVGAQTGTFLGEFVWIRYPDVNPNGLVRRNVNGVATEQAYAAGLWTWPTNPGDPNTNLKGVGTKDSMGYMFDFSLTYDGTLIPGWQVIPGVFFSHAVKGETPNFLGNWLEGAKSVNYYMLFNKNPAKWQAGINYARFFGGKTAIHQPLADRDFLGGFVSYNF
jgi:hypothetical protein